MIGLGLIKMHHISFFLQLIALYVSQIEPKRNFTHRKTVTCRNKIKAMFAFLDIFNLHGYNLPNRLNDNQARGLKKCDYIECCCFLNPILYFN